MILGERQNNTTFSSPLLPCRRDYGGDSIIFLDREGEKKKETARQRLYEGDPLLRFRR